jgi:hypothetical protein
VPTIVAAIEVSSGAVLQARAGAIVLLEDVEGVSQQTAVLGSDDVLIAAV